MPSIQLNLLNKSTCTVQKLHLILSHRYLVLSNIQLVLSKIHLVLSKFWLVHNIQLFCWKIIMYCPKISSNFVDSTSCTVPISTGTVRKLSCYVPVVSSFLVSYCPNFNLYIPTIQLKKLKNSLCTVQKNHLILSKCYLVLFYSSTCTVWKTSCPDPFSTCTYPTFKLFCWCNHHVLSNDFTRFCRIVVLYCINFDLYCQKIDLNFLKNLSRFRFNIDDPFHNNC